MMNVKASTRTGMVMEAIRQKIASRQLEAGERLPSIRSLAEKLGVSPSTVVEAYDRLVADGAIHSKPGSGFYVSSVVSPFALANTEPALDREIDPFWVSRQSLDANTMALKPGCGWLPPDWMPDEALRRAVRALARADTETLTDYGSTRGIQELRTFLARQFVDEGLNMSPDQVLLTGSGTQAIDLVCRFLLRPGDTVLIDDPCYFNFQALLRAHQVTIVGVPYTENGPGPHIFEELVQSQNPQLYITNSALHNPTGATLSPPMAHKILSIADAHKLVIIEDDIFAGFEPEPSPRLAVLDGLDRVIRIGSFSKTLSASIRCGYITARQDWIEGLVDLQVATNFGGPSPFAAGLIYSALKSGSFRKHMESIRRRLAQKRHAVSRNLAKIGIQPLLVPRGGFYLWCQLPGGCDASKLANRALKENIILAPGNVFSVTQSMPDFMRFNVSQMNEPYIFDLLGDLITEVT